MRAENDADGSMLQGAANGKSRKALLHRTREKGYSTQGNN
jgi:hypothetical protein